MLVESDDIIKTLKEELELLDQRLSSIVGQQAILKKLIQYYVELAQENENKK